MRTFIIKPGDLIPIGRAGENQATEICFDVTGWAETFGAGTFELIMQRPGDSELPYPVEVTVDGDYVVWTVSNVDTGIAGNCKVQLRYVVSDAVAKSVIYRGIVGESLDHAVDPPDPYDDLIERIEELARQTEQNAEAASRSAGNASDSADAAGRSAGNASDSADAAGRSANNAAQSVTDANAAKLAAQAAQQYAEAAQAGAEAAEARIMDTVPDAVTNWLNLHVDPATGYVIDDSLTIANAAADAKAVGDALVDKAPIITDTASGAIASFPDGSDAPIKQLTVGIEPQQDLHGYDNPWPAGGGKNLLPTSVSGIKSANAAGTWSGNEYTYNGVKYTLNTDQDGNVTGINANGTASADSDIYLVQGYTFPAGSYTLNGCPSGGSSSTYRIFATNWGGDTGSGATVTLNGSTSTSIRVQIKNGTTVNNLLFKPMVRLSSVTDATFAPYSNICPITGWTGANVTGAGVNIWDEEWELGILDGHGVEQPSTNAIRAKEFIPILPNNKYYVVSGSGKYVYGFFYNADKVKVGAVNIRNSVFTAPSNAYYFRFSMGSEYRATYNNDISINAPYTDTEYHAYAGTTYPITWQSEAGTVYGGTLTVAQDGTGTLVADRANVDMGTLTWNYNSAQLSMTSNALASVIGDGVNIVCSNYKTATDLRGSVWANTDKAIAINKANCMTTGNFAIGAIVVKDTDYTDAVTFKTAMSGVQLVYELATPITYTLSEELTAEITTLLGQNNVWANCGDIVGIQYRCDTKLYIDKKLAALVAALS